MECATAYLRDKNDAAWKKWHLEKHNRFDWKQDGATIVFSGGDTEVLADIQFIGSWSQDTDTWMWAWHNESIKDNLKKAVCDVRRFGEFHGLPELTESILDGPIEAAWDMTALSCYILQSEMGYRAPDSTKDRFTFLSLSNFRNTVEQGAAANP
jgi:hypothetical protein